MLLNKWIKVYDQSEKKYSVNKEIKIKTPMLKSDLCHYSDACSVARGIIAVTEPENTKELKVLRLKRMHHLSIAFQKSVV